MTEDPPMTLIVTDNQDRPIFGVYQSVSEDGPCFRFKNLQEGGENDLPSESYPDLKAAKDAARLLHHFEERVRREDNQT